MSATLRIDDFTGNRRLFPAAPPVVHVPARQYPITVHFNRRTELDDFVGAAYQKVSWIALPVYHTPACQNPVTIHCIWYSELSDFMSPAYQKVS